MNLGLPIPKTDGQLFFRLFDEVHECTFSEALDIVIREIVVRSADRRVNEYFETRIVILHRTSN